MQSSFHELGTLVPNGIYVKNIYIKNSFAYAENDDCSRVLSTLAKELTTATCLMQSSFNDLSTLVSHSAKCKQTKANTYVL